MQTHVKVIGVLFVVCAVITGLLAVGIPMGLGVIGYFLGHSGDPDAATGALVMGIGAAVVAVLFGVTAILYAISGYGVLQHKSWGRIMGIIMSVFALIKFPFGTAMGVYGLWVFFNKDTEAIFKG